MHESFVIFKFSYAFNILFISHGGYKLSFIHLEFFDQFPLKHSNHVIVFYKLQTTQMKLCNTLSCNTDMIDYKLGHQISRSDFTVFWFNWIPASK